MARICATITRLPSASQKLSTHHLHKPWCAQSQCVIQRSLTNQEKVQQKQEQTKAKATYQQALQEAQNQVRMLAEGLRAQFQKHSVEHYYEEIMQTAHLQKNCKKAGSWNAYVSMETQQMNAELPPGVPKKKVHDFIADIAAKWKLLSNEEKIQLTEERLTTLHNTREMRDLASHNVSISVYHDTHNTLNNLDEE
ncbi:hypothetical protein C0995_014905, partial [Termitomyces sp. Mi166